MKKNSLKIMFFAAISTICISSNDASAFGGYGFAQPVQYGYVQPQVVHNNNFFYAGHRGRGHGRGHYEEDCERDWNGHNRRQGFYAYQPQPFYAPRPYYNPPVVVRNYYPQPAYVPIYPQNSINLQFGF